MNNQMQEKVESLEKENKALRNANLVLLSKYATEHDDNKYLRVKIETLKDKIKRMERL